MNKIKVVEFVKRKLVSIVTIVAMLSTLVSAVIISSPVSATASWYNASWLYRNQFTVTGSSSGAVTLYQIPLTVYYGSGSDSGLTTYCSSECKANFGDLRFTAADGTTLIPYYIQSYVASTSAVVWVQLDSVPSGSGTNTFYMYYDNAAATTTSSGTNTFLFFDDTSTNMLGSYTSTPMYSGGGGSLSYLGTPPVIGTNSSSNGLDAWTFGPTVTNSRLIINERYGNQGGNGSLGAIVRMSASGMYYGVEYATGQWNICGEPTPPTATEPNYANEVNSYAGGYVDEEVDIYSTSIRAIFNNGTPLTVTQGSFTAAGKDALYRGYSADNTGIIDLVIEANYISPEPTVTSWAGQEAAVLTPVVTTQAASSVTTGGAVLNGNVTSIGGSSVTTRGFVYGLTTSFGTDTHTTGTYSTGAYTTTLSTLTYNTQYYYEAYATNSSGTTYGAQQTFTTLNLGTTVTVQAASSVANTTATLNGNLTNLNGGGSATQEGFDLGLSSGVYTINDVNTGTFSTGAYTYSATGLNPGTVYYIRAKAQNTLGWGYSSETTFTTAGSSYLFNRQITITGSSSGAVTNYPVQINLQSTSTPNTYAGLLNSLPFIRTTGYTPIFTPGVAGVPACDNLGFPVIMVDPADSTKLLMYFNGLSQNQNAGIYSSFVMLATTSVNTPTSGWTLDTTDIAGGIVLTPGQGGFDAKGTRLESVVYVNGTYYMYYGALVTLPAGSSQEYICEATSTDGIHFTKSNNNPLIAGASEPDVMYSNGVFYMYYNSNGTKIATSSDGLIWNFTGTSVSYGSPAGYGGSEDSSVTQVGSLYVIVYDSYHYPSIVNTCWLASSSSPYGPFINSSSLPILGGSGNASTFDADGAASPFLFYSATTNQWLLYYQGCYAPSSSFQWDPYGIGVVSANAASANGGSVILNGNVKSDFSDIQFTQSDGVTTIPYWIQSVNNGTAVVWVNVPSIPASPSTTMIYIYYDNALATTASSGTNTFTFFTDGTTNMSGSFTSEPTWNGTSGTMAYDAVNHCYTLTRTVTSNNAWVVGSNIASSRIMAIAKVQTAGASAQMGIFSRYSGTGDYFSWDMLSSQYNSIVKEMSPPTTSQTNLGGTPSIFAANTYYNMEFDTYGSTITSIFNGSSISVTDSAVTTGKAGFYAGNDTTTVIDLKQFIVANYISPEPTFTVSAQSPGQGGPTVVTNTASVVTASSMALNGTITAVVGTSSIQAQGFEWGTLTGVYPNSHTTPVTNGGTSSFAYNITGLNPGVMYYFKAMAEDSTGTWGYGSEVTQATSSSSSVPVFTTGTAASVTSTSAILQGTLTSLGNYTPVIVYFEWGTTSTYGTTTTQQTETASGAFSQAITGLTANTTIYFRADILYSGNTVNGSGTSFITQTPGVAPVTITNFVVSAYTSTTATLTWTPVVGATTIIQYSNTNYPSSPSIGTNIYNGSGSTITQTGMTTGMRYYYSAWSYANGIYSAASVPATVVPSTDTLPAPDILQIESVQMYQNYITAGDQLMVLSYKIVWNSGMPTQFNPSDFFYIQVWNGVPNATGSTLMMQNRITNWGYVPGSLYIGINSNLQWNYGYTIVLVGTSKFTTPPSVSYTMTQANYIGTDMTQLAQWCLDLGGRMEASHFYTTGQILSYGNNSGALQLEPSGNVIFTTYGGQLFSSAIPGLQKACPQLFSASISPVTYTPTTGSSSYRNALLANAQTVEGTQFWGIMTNWSLSTGIPIHTVNQIFWVVAGLLVMLMVMMIGAPIQGAIPAGVVIWLLGTMLGGFDMYYLIAIGICGAFLLVLKVIRW